MSGRHEGASPAPTPDPHRFAERVAIVTGAGRGIGAATARRLAAEGARVVITARSGAEIEALAAEIGEQGGEALALRADVADPDAVQALTEEVLGRLGRIDLLVNNAGIVTEAPLLEMAVEDWSSVIAVNLSGAFFMTQRVGRAMREGGGGAIVHVASIDAHGADGPAVSYNSSKAGLLGLNRTAAVELAPYGIRSNVVSPGFVATPMIRESVSDPVWEHLSSAFERVPQRRMVTPEEIAAAISFLGCPEAAAITGSELVVDGGTIANLYIFETLPEG